jgi:hypothetical protein
MIAIPATRSARARIAPVHCRTWVATSTPLVSCREP